MSRKSQKPSYGMLLLVIAASMAALPINLQASEVPQSVTQTGNTFGVVTDPNGDPIIGATIKSPDGNSGTVTDVDGNFSINVPSGTELEISYVGYITTKVKATSGSMRITLKEDTRQLSDVVVVGFGTQKKVNLTGSVGVATSKDLEARPVTNAAQALQGIVPGLQITNSSGELDKGLEINVRGAGTIGEGSSGAPLILIDGMEGDLNTINPQDIENISVLKDAAASSIYGSRAPFGVILVTTKSGKAGRFSVNYNNSFRFSSPINLPHEMNSYEFANFMNQASENSGGGSVFSDELMQKMLDFQASGEPQNTGTLQQSQNGQWGKPQYDPYTTAYANTDWYYEIYRTHVFSQEHNVSASGGSENVTFYTSFNYLDQGGMLRKGNDGQHRYNATAKVSAKITPWLKLNTNVRFTRNNIWRPSQFSRTFYQYIQQTWPNLPVYDNNGYIYNNGLNGSAAMRLVLGGDRKSVTDQHYFQAALVLEPIKNWITHVEMNYGITNGDVKETTLPQYNHNVAGEIIDTKATTNIFQGNSKENYANYNIYSEYSFSLDKAHNFKVMAGFQSEEMKYDYMSVQKYGIIDTEKPFLNLTTGKDGKGNAKDSNISGYAQEWSTAGFFGRLNYDYLERYLFEGNLRYDGTSRFRRGSRWQLAPSFSLGWNIAREKFWEPMTGIANQLKLRFSYGELSNQNTSSWYPTYRMMNIAALSGAWLQNGAKPNTAEVSDLVSSVLTWEKVRTWDIGLDFGLFNNRLTGTFDYYTRYTDGMVGPAPELPATLGVSAPKTNNCDLKTNGWELQIGWRDRLKMGLNYVIKLSLSDARTYVESYPGNATNSLDLNINNDSGSVTYVEGRELGEIWGFKTVGIAKTDEEMNAHLEKVGGQNALGSDWAAGDVMYQDLDGKPGITKGAGTLDDHGDLTVIGNTTPRYLFGIDLNASWKGFDFRAFFQGVMKADYWGNDWFLAGLFGTKGDGGMWSMSAFEGHDDYFRATDVGLPGHIIPANTDAFFPRPLFKNMKNEQAQTRYLQDASYIRLKNLQIGYSLPATILSHIGINACRIYISGENLWTSSKLFKQFDPETIRGGRGGNGYPLSKTWSFGLSVTL